jgi:hypothetical protein
MKRPAACLEDVRMSPAEQQGLHRELVQCSTHTGLVQTLAALHSRGRLRDGALNFKPRQLAKELTKAKKMHSDLITPYGRVVQQMELESERMPLWEYCNPMALIWYLASLSSAFFDLMADTITDAVGNRLHVILYIDAVIPGNPLRHDKGRSLEAIYWAFAEWPAWLLARSGAWPIFGVLRTSIATALPGGISQLMANVLRTFFPSDAHSMSAGIIISHDGRSINCRADFGGYLADEKALKEINDCKGASGTLRFFKQRKHKHYTSQTEIHSSIVCRILEISWCRARHRPMHELL